MNPDNSLVHERAMSPDPSNDQVTSPSKRQRENEPLNHSLVADARLYLDHVSPSGRQPATLLDMPTEILLEILGWVQLGDTESASDSIQDCRLTCRRLSQIADHFLITDGTLRLSLDEESLSRLETISQSPTIRNMVKTLELELALFPRMEGERPLRAFASLAAYLLDVALGKYNPDDMLFTCQEHWPACIVDGMERVHDEVGLIHDVCHFLHGLGQPPGVWGERAWALCKERVLLQTDRDCEWSDVEPVVDALVKQAEIYRQLFLDQQSLLGGEFVPRLVTALGQMRNLDAIRFTEWDLNRIESATGSGEPPSPVSWKKGGNKGTVKFPFDAFAFAQNPDQSAIDILVQSKFFLKPLPMMRIGEGPHHLFSFMAKLMESLTTRKLSHVVKNLDIGFWVLGYDSPEPSFQWRPRGLGTTWLTFGEESDQSGSAYTEHQRQIRLGTQNLESFSLGTVCENADRKSWPCPCPATRMEILLSPFLQAPNLRKLNIQHSYDARGYPSHPYHKIIRLGPGRRPLSFGPRFTPGPFFPDYRGYIGRGLAARVSPFLCDITIKGAILHQRDLVTFLQHGLERPLHQLHLENIWLQTGTWRSMLAFLRRLKMSESSEPKSLVEFTGAELGRMTWSQFAWRHKLSDPSCVLDFINGKDDEPNPIDRAGLDSSIYEELRAHDEKVLREEREWVPHDHAEDEVERDSDSESDEE